MVKIYGAYTELDCVFDDANACRLADQLPEADRAELSFDTAAIDWDTLPAGDPPAAGAAPRRAAPSNGALRDFTQIAG